MIVSNDYNRVAAKQIEIGDMRFTQDWVSCHIPAWERLYPLLAGRERILEIGSFEGMSACWFMEHYLSNTGTMYCLDTWEGGHEISQSVANEAFVLFKANTAIAKKQGQTLEVMQRRSIESLAQLLTLGHERSFDFIYIDGSHQACDVVLDTAMAWPLLKRGGILLWDDYLFEISGPVERRPKLAIDAFTLAFGSHISTLLVGDQYAVRKIKE